MRTKRLIYIMENMVESDTKSKNIVFFCKYFKEKGIKVTFLTTINEENKNIHEFANGTPIVKLARTPSIKDDEKPLLFPLKYLFSNRKNYDTVWCYLNMPSSFYSTLMKKFFGKNLMIKCDMAYPTKDKNWFNRFWKYWTVNFPLKNADFILTESKDIYEEVMKINPKGAVEVIPNGVPAKEFEKTDKKVGKIKKENLIISVGRLEPYKGNKDLILAFSKFYKNNKNWKLAIVGPNKNENYVNELKALAKKEFPDYEKSKVIEFTGPKFGDDLVRMFKRAKIFCVASHKKDRGDSFNNALPQAIFFGAHPVVTDAGRLWTQVEGLPVDIVPSENPEKLAEALEKSKNSLIPEKKLRDYIKDKFNWDKNLLKIRIP